MKTMHITVGATALALTACTTVPAPASVEADFGNSVRSVVAAQTLNPSTLTTPSAAPLTGVDGDYANAVVEALRKNVPEPEDVKRPIVVQVGGWSN